MRGQRQVPRRLPNIVRPGRRHADFTGHKRADNQPVPGFFRVQNWLRSGSFAGEIGGGRSDQSVRSGVERIDVEWGERPAEHGFVGNLHGLLWRSGQDRADTGTFMITFREFVALIRGEPGLPLTELGLDQLSGWDPALPPRPLREFRSTGRGASAQGET